MPPEFRRNPESLIRILSERRASGAAKVDQAIGAARLSYITDVAGQQMIYVAKEGEARAWLALTAPPGDMSAFPLLSAEVGTTADTADELAQIWLNLSHLWRGVAANLERVRVGANKAINSAETDREIQAIVEMVSVALTPRP